MFAAQRMGIVQRQSIQTSILTYIGAALGYVNFILLYPRFMQPVEVGLIRVLIAVGVLLSQLSLLGSSYTLQRFFPYFNDRSKRHHGFLGYVLLLSCVGFAVFGLMSWWGRGWVYHAFEARSPLFVSRYVYMYPLALAIMFFEVLFFYARSLLLTVLPVFFREVLLRLLQTLALLAFVGFGLSFDVFLWLFLATYLLHLVAIVVYLFALGQLFVFKKIELNGIVSLRQLNRFGLFVYLASIASIYTSNIDTIMLGARAGLDATAVYAVAFFIGTLVVIPSRAMNQVAIPLIADAWKRNDLAHLQKLYKQTANNQLIVGAFIVLMLLLNTHWILMMLPPVYAKAEPVVYIIAAARLLDMATGANGELILYSKHVKFNLATNLLLIVITTVAMWFFIGWYGVAGAALAVMVAYAVYNGIRLIFLWATYRMQPFMTSQLLLLLIFITMALFVWFLPDDYKSFVYAVLISMGLALLYWGLVLRLKLSEEISALGKKVLSEKLF